MQYYAFLQPSTQSPRTGANRSTLPTRGEASSAAPAAAHSRTWSIVLAGGEGERLRPLTERWLGTHRPKQYCAFVGRRSMLQHTLDRAMCFSGPDRTLVVVAKHHAPDVWEHLHEHHWEQTILQPTNRDTAPGIFLPLAHIHTRDPEGVVVILPSDHFVFPEQGFLTAVGRTIRAAHRLPDKLVLLGTRPDGPETEYGWIAPGATVDWLDGHAVRKVVGFHEKPSRLTAQHLFATGGLWNTMVMACRVQTLWQLGWRWLPDMMYAFDGLKRHLGTESELEVLEEMYETLPNANFSSHLVERAVRSAVVLELRDVVWSDWGNERRIVETLKRIGKRPSFAVAGQSRRSGNTSAPPRPRATIPPALWRRASTATAHSPCATLEEHHDSDA